MSVTDGSKTKPPVAIKQTVKLEEKPSIRVSHYRRINSLCHRAGWNHPPTTLTAFIAKASSKAPNLVHLIPMLPDVEAMRAWVLCSDRCGHDRNRSEEAMCFRGSSFEKYECVCNDFPNNMFHLRHPIVSPLPGTLGENRKYTSRFSEAMGPLITSRYGFWRRPKWAGKLFATHLYGHARGQASHDEGYCSALLPHLGTTLDGGGRPQPLYSGRFAAVCTQKNKALRGSVPADGNVFLLQKNYSMPSSTARWANHRLVGQLWRLLEAHEALRQRIPLVRGTFPRRDAFGWSTLTGMSSPFILTAGQRRAGNTEHHHQEPKWDAKNKMATLYMNPTMAAAHLKDGDPIQVCTQKGSAKPPWS